jgi:hypothetical protein
MALSATFTANFASFYDAVDKADVKLKDFGAGADKVSGRLTALGNSFSGVKLIQDALLMVKAVEDIGGASKLTEKELARLGATANEAVSKMKALGMDVPKSLQEIADKTKATTTATTAATTATTDWAGSVKGLAASFGIGFGLKEVIGLGKAIIDDAGHIADMSAKLGISTTAVQKFGFAAEQTGASMDTIGTAIGKMNVTLAGGDKSTVAALEQMGLKFGDIRAMKPEDAFLAIAGAIAKIPDPMQQAEAATKLFGKTGAELLPAIRQGLQDVADTAPIMADRFVQAADRIGDRLAKLKKQALNAGGEVIGGLELIVETSYSYLDELNRKAFQSIEDNAKHAKDSAAAIKTALGTDKNDLSGYLGGLGMGLGGPKTAADDLRIATAAMKDLTAEQRKNIDASIALGKSTDETATKTGVAADVVKLYTDAQKKTTDAEKKATDAAAEHLKKINDLAASLSGVGLTQKTKDLNEAVALSGLVYGRAALNTQATVDAVRALAREGAALPPLLRDIYLRHLDWAGAGVKVEVGIKSILTDLPNYTQQLKNFMNVQFFNFKLPDFKTQIGNLFENLPNLAPQFKAWGKQNIEDPMRASAAAAADAMATEFSIVDTAFGALGQHGGAAWKAAMQLSEIAVDGMIRYQNAITDADRETVKMQTTTAIATTAMTIGIDYMIGQWMHYRAQINAAQSTIANLQQQIADLGGEPIGPIVTDPNENPYFKKRIEDLRQQLKNLQTEQENARKAQEELNAAIQKYGLTFKDLEQGPVQALKILEDQFLHTFNALTSAGYKSSSVIHGMRDDLNDLVRTALDTRQQLPASFRPFLEQLIRSGELADDVKRKLLGLADPAPWEDMKTAAEKYGIALGDLGPAFQQSRLDSMSKDLLADWDLLVTHGANVDAVIKGMSGKVNDLVHDSIKFGVDIPANMKPMLDAMVKAGTLTDDAGNKLTDLSSLHFAADIEADFDKLIQKLDELIDKLGGGGVAHPNSVAGAAERTATDVENAFNNVRINPIHVPYVFDAENPPDFNIPGGGRTPTVPAMARGGIVTRPTFALIGEAGPEAVVPLGAGGALAPIYITVVSELDGREVARNQVRYIPNALRVAGI